MQRRAYGSSRRLGWLAGLAVFALPMAALACRIIVPPWPPPPWLPPLPRPVPPPPRTPEPMEVREHRAMLEIRRHSASVTVEAIFHNPNPFPIEGVYVFPIGRDAAVSSFAMTVDGRTLEAELLPADEARRIYEDIVRRAKDPALLEYAGEGMLRARVFPIEGRRDVRIQLAYETALRGDGSLRRLAYPLLSAKPEGRNRIGRVRIEARLETEQPLRNIFVPGFDVTVRRPDGRRAEVVWEATSLVPERDFEVLFSEDARPVGVDVLTYKEGDDGYFMMLLAPDSELQSAEIGAKEITFVVDTSGSMMGDKMRQAAAALTFCVNALRDSDSFNIVAFATDVRPFVDRPVPATAENRRQALDFIAGLRTSGGTAIDQALRQTLQGTPPPDRPAFVVFLTDGLPTVGETNPEAILKTARAAAGERRLFVFGVGYDVNTRLLDGLSQGTRGSSTYVRPQEDLELALSAFYARIAHPVMTDLRLETGSVRLTDRNPPELPDLFRGSEIRMTGRYGGSGKVDMVLSGAVGQTRESFRFAADLDGNRRNTFIPRLWAMARVGYLQDQIRINGPNPELLEEIRRLGRRYGILTEHTSFLIVEDNVDRARVQEARRVFRESLSTLDGHVTGAVAVERAARAKGLQSEAMAGAVVTAPTAVPMGEAGQPMRQVIEAAGLRAEDVGATVRHADNKTFYLRRDEGVWYDSLIPAGTAPRIDLEVTAWSEAFFVLAAEHPELARCLQVSENLVVVLGGRTIRIRP